MKINAPLLAMLFLVACGDKDTETGSAEADTDTDTDTDTDADADADTDTDTDTDSAACSGDEGCLVGTGGFDGASGGILCDSDSGELSAAVSDGGVSVQCTIDGLVHVSLALGWAPGSDPAPGTYTFSPGQEASDSGTLILQATLWSPDESWSTTQLFNKDTITLDVASIEGAAGTADFTVEGAWLDEAAVDLTAPSWQWACSEWVPSGCAPGDAGCECDAYFAPAYEGSLDVRFVK